VKAFEARRHAKNARLPGGDGHTRRTWIKLSLSAVAACRAAVGKESRMFQQILELSLSEKKSVTVYIGGQSLAGGVVKLNGDTVELRSLEHPRIVIRLESIDAVALV
jgi:FAD/FMN-containing dehydrogenase